LNNNADAKNRFLIRMGSKGWMVYDRQSKGPAVIGTDLAADLTKAQAERVYRTLAHQAVDSRSASVIRRGAVSI